MNFKTYFQTSENPLIAFTRGLFQWWKKVVTESIDEMTKIFDPRYMGSGQFLHHDHYDHNSENDQTTSSTIKKVPVHPVREKWDEIVGI